MTVFTGSGGGAHTATFPRALVRPRILSSCPAGGLVLDPFCGSGREIMEAVDSGRRGIGFELSPTYARLARANISTTTSSGSEPESSVPPNTTGG